METRIDAKGKACPVPFMLAKQQIDLGNTEFFVEVDNAVAVENLRRLARSQNYTIETSGKEFPVVHFRGSGPKPEQENITEPMLSCTPVDRTWALFIGKDRMGEGDPLLGRNLVRMFLYTIDQGTDLPASVVLMNSGVHLAVNDEQTVATLHSLQEKGVVVLVCGTCLQHYDLVDQVKTGTVSNMYDISSAMLSPGRLITL